MDLAVSSTATSVRGLLANREFSPAAVQRNFQWDTEEAQTMLLDIIRAWNASHPSKASCVEPTDATADTNDAECAPPVSNNHACLEPFGDYYLGTIVMRTNEQGVAELFDGLQRVTTLTILLAVLRDLTTDIACKTELDELINIRGRYPRLLLGLNDWSLAREIQPLGEAAKSRRSEPFSDMHARIRDIARSFRKTIRTWQQADIADFAAFLSEQVALIIVETQSARLARQIFVTTNLRGLPLNQANLLKGELMDMAPNEIFAKTIEEFWNKVTYRVGDDIVPFFTAVDQLTRHSDQGPDCLHELTDYLKGLDHIEYLTDWMQKAERYAAAWHSFQDILDNEPQTDYAAQIWRLQLFRWSNWKPLALHWHAEYLKRIEDNYPQRPAKLIASSLNRLHHHCLVLTLQGASSQARSIKFQKAVRLAIVGKNPFSGPLAFTEDCLADAQRTLDHPIHERERAMTVLRWLEASMHDIPPAYVWNGTIEHVLPQNPEAESDWLQDFQQYGNRTKYTELLGNKLLLPAELNNRLHNSNFSIKKPLILKEASHLKTFFGFKDFQKWNNAAIKTRNDRIRSHIIGCLKPFLKQARQVERNTAEHSQLSLPAPSAFNDQHPTTH